MKVAALDNEPSNLHADASTMSKEKEKLCLPSIERQDAHTTSYSTTASDESWARGIFGKRQQPADMDKVSTWNTASSLAGAPAAVGAAEAPAAAQAELGAAFRGNVGNEQHPRDAGLGFGSSSGARSAGLVSTEGISSCSAGPVSAGDATAVTTSASTAAGQDGDCPLDQQDSQEEDGAALLSPLPSMPSAPTSTAAPERAEMDGNDKGSEGLELLHDSDSEEAEAAGLFDAVDELLGEAVLGGFGAGSGEEDILPFVW